MSLTEAKVVRIPDCQVHPEEEAHPAGYDALVWVPALGRRTWAYVCERGFTAGDGKLGTGRGQRLILDEQEWP